MEATAFIAGVVIGGLLVFAWLFGRVIGNLRVDNSEPDEPPRLFLELYQGVGNISAKKYIRLRVRVENFLSQK